MNIVDKLKNKECSEEELLECLESFNPIILYETMSYIVRNHIMEKKIVNKLIYLSKFMSDEYKMLGYYKIGHVAMGTLLKLGVDEKEVFTSDIDEFDKATVERFINNV